MSNDYGLKCPECGQVTDFEIYGHHTITIQGTDDPESDDSMYWDDEDTCTCVRCRHISTVGDFLDVGEN